MKRVVSSPAAPALLVIAAFLAVATTFNIFTAMHDAASHGQVLPRWQPVTWEYTSGIASLLSAALVYWAVRIAPPASTRWPKLIAVHAVASLAFSSLHILLMSAMRAAVYAALGRHYGFGSADFWYEYRKDVIAYLVWATVFWLFIREARQRAPRSSGARLIDIRDGTRLLRVPIDHIDAVHAAGNYVEFVLTDQRRPMARRSLSLALLELGDSFVRTHRSWAINIAHVRELRATGTGDYEIEFASGLKVPLSRRFPQALSRLRNPQDMEEPRLRSIGN